MADAAGAANPGGAIAQAVVRRTTPSGRRGFRVRLFAEATPRQAEWDQQGVVRQKDQSPTRLACPDECLRTEILRRLSERSSCFPDT